ncbi:hypothetical protein E4U51_000759 [Claviceps purpurea]|nr:hypothetical protein E4U51_000759 [Claviceps purpurea]
MIACAKWARENKRNYLGICLGMQVTTVEISRSLCGRSKATSEEWVDDNATSTPKMPTTTRSSSCLSRPKSESALPLPGPPSMNTLTISTPLLTLMSRQLGGTMRLGTRPSLFQAGSERSKLRALYGGASEIHEHHRHRYEVNPARVDELEEAGLHFVAKDETGNRMEAFELKDHLILQYSMKSACGVRHVTRSSARGVR